VRGVLLGLVVAGCLVPRATTPKLTGTCEGACAHYVACKASHSQLDQQRCTAECPSVFNDADSLMGYESLTCPDAVEFVDGTHPKTT
jgi:hypothetical protein